VDSTAFNRLRTDFVRAPKARLAAIASSIGVAASNLILLLILFLFVDLIASRGIIPGYSQLTAAKQKEFAAEWAARPEAQRLDAARRVAPYEPTAKVLVGSDRPPTAWEWELRWRAGMYLALRERVSDAAAEAYQPEKIATNGEPPPRLGVLSLVARERNRWTGRVIGSIAAWNSWMWQPGSDNDANVSYLTGLFFLAFLLAVVRGILVNVQVYLAAAVMLDVVTRLRRSIFLQAYRVGIRTTTVGKGEAAQLFTRQAEAVGAAVHGGIISAYRCPLLIGGLLVVILVANFWLAVSFLLLAALVWLIGGQITAHYRREGRLGSRQVEASMALLIEGIGLLPLVKCFRMERFNQNRMERQLGEATRNSWRQLRGNALGRSLLSAVGLMAGVALLFLAARAVLAGEFSVAGVVLMVVALVSLLQPIADWFDYRHKLRRGREAAEAISEFLERKGDAAEATDAEYLPALTTRMEFRAVRLEEPGTGRVLLDNVTFAVPAGSRVAFVGPDPKETHALIQLIPRFVDPNAGEIRIQDKNLRWVTHESLRTQVAVVLQDDWMFTDTIVNNIGCGDQEFTMPQIIEAAKLAHAHQFIEQLPHGYETVVGTHGHQLKVGERFRLALARALLRDPSILIIEEPTGSVDEDTLALLDDTLERAAAGRTIIFLASRISTLRSVNRVFLIKQGRLEAAGTHEELWETNESYRRLQLMADAPQVAVEDE
jgi:ATP-binding cassette subfamily B protein